MAVVKLARALSELTQIAAGHRQAPSLAGRLLESCIYKPQTVAELSKRLGVPRRAIRLELAIMVMGDEVRMLPSQKWIANDLRPIG